MIKGCDAIDPHLQILPSGTQEVSAGKNLVLTCRAQVPNLELMKDMKWIDPLGQDISQDNRWKICFLWLDILLYHLICLQFFRLQSKVLNVPVENIRINREMHTIIWIEVLF